MATLSDVARLAGVSKSTASRALGKPELVAPATVARVRDAAASLGFMPNRAARSLARGTSGIVAVVVPTLENLFFSPIIGGAQRRAAEADLHLTVVVNELGGSEDLAGLKHLAGQIDGLLLVAPRVGDDVVRAVATSAPTVLVDREVDGLASVVADTATAFGSLVSRLGTAGRRRIVYIGGPSGSWQDGQRTRAVRAAAAESGAELTVLGPCQPAFSSGVHMVEPIVAAGADAVVPYATPIGLGVMFGLAARGRTVPDDVVVSLESDVVDVLGLGTAPAIDVDGDALGQSAMALLLERVQDGRPTVQERLPVEVRASRPDRPAS